MSTCAYITYSEWQDPEDPDVDAELARAALNQYFDTDIVVWDDPDVDAASYDVVLVRGVWDYVPKRQQFLAWANRVAASSLMINPAAVFEANTDKSYLMTLAQRGVPCVPTAWVDSATDIDHALATWPGMRLVVKPRIGAGAWDSIVTDDFDSVRVHAKALLERGSPCLIQPYLDEVDHVGEVSVVCIDGDPQWAVRKVPALTEGGHGDGAGRVDLTNDLVDAARRVLEAWPESADCTWARVDLVPTDGEFVLMELELTEPTLFLPHVDEGAGILADAVFRRWQGREGRE